MSSDNKVGSNVLEMPAMQSSSETAFPRCLSMAERLAIEAVQQRLAAAQYQMRALLEDMGLDPNRNWRVSPDGVVTPA